MKLKQYLAFIFVFLFGYGIAQAQQINPDDIFKAGNYISNGTYDGRPFVMIDGVEPKTNKKPQGWFDEAKQRLFGRDNILEQSYQQPQFEQTDLNNIQSVKIPQSYAIKPLFGEKQATSFVDYTHSFFVTVQLVNATDIFIEENIQFISTSPFKIRRILPHKSESVKIISFIKNNRNAPFEIKTTDDSVVVQDLATSEAGTYSLQIRYILQNAIEPITSKKSRLKLDITGTQWAQAIENFRVIILYPQKLTLYTHDLVFGTNNLSLKNSYITKTDANSNTFYKLNKLLPAFANVTIIEEFNPENLLVTRQQPLSDKEISQLLISGFLCFVLIYLILGALFLKKDMKNEFEKAFLKLPFFMLAYINQTPINRQMLISLKKRSEYLKKKTRLISFLFYCLPHRSLFYLVKKALISYAVLFFNKKYLCAEIILALITQILIHLKNLPQLNSYWAIALVILFIAHSVFYRYCLKPFIKNQALALNKRIFNKKAYIGLTKKEIQSLYIQYAPVLSVFNNQEEWIQMIEESDNSIKLTTF